MIVQEIVAKQPNTVLNEFDPPDKISGGIYDVRGKKAAALLDPTAGAVTKNFDGFNITHGENTPKFVPVRSKGVELEVWDVKQQKNVTKTFYAVKPTLVPNPRDVIYFESKSAASAFMKARGAIGGVNHPLDEISNKEIQDWNDKHRNKQAYTFDRRSKNGKGGFGAHFIVQGEQIQKVRDHKKEFNNKVVKNYIAKYDAAVKKYGRQMVKVLQSKWYMKSMRGIGVLSAAYIAFDNFAEGLAEAYERGAKNGNVPEEIMAYIQRDGLKTAIKLGFWWMGVVTVAAQARRVVRWIMTSAQMASLATGPWGMVATGVFTIIFELAAWGLLSTEIGKRSLISLTQNVLELFLDLLLNDVRILFAGGAEISIPDFSETEQQTLVRKIAQQAAKEVGADTDIDEKEVNDLIDQKKAEKSGKGTDTISSGGDTIDSVW